MGKKSQRARLQPTVKPPPVPAPKPVMAAPAPTEQPPQRFFTKEDWIAAGASFLIAGFTYFFYMSPEVTLQDSGELVTGAFNFGVPHPTGYPLWAFLGWVWRHLVAFGNPAWRLALFSVVTGAALVGILTLLMSRSILMLLRNSPWGEALDDSARNGLSLSVGTAVSLMFAFNRGVWQWACVPEMRALNAFSYVATTCILFAWMMRPGHHRYLYALLLAWGLSLANHQTIIVMIFPFVLGMWLVGFLGDRTDKHRYAGLMEFGFACLVAWTVGVLVNAWLLSGAKDSLWNQQVKTVLLFGPKSKPLPVVLLAGGSAGALLAIGTWARTMSWKHAVCCAAIFLAALSLYVYMPVAASTNPPMNWGFASTKQGFLHAITRGQYEQLRLSFPWSEKFWIQMGLFVDSLLKQYGWIIGVFAVVPAIVLFGGWSRLKPRARQWLIFALASFLVTWVGLIIIIGPDIDKQQQEINLKFFVGAHGFFAMLIGYGVALTLAWGLTRWPKISRRGVVAGSWVLVAYAAIPFAVNWEKCEQRGHDFGYQFGYRMFFPGGGYEPMERDAVLYGGTDPGRFVPTYMIFCESRVAPKDRYHDPHLDPEGGASFDRRDVYIITQNALADDTYMSYIRDHYDYSRPDPDSPKSLENRSGWQCALLKQAWVPLGRDRAYPKEPIWIPSERDTQLAFQKYVDELRARTAGAGEDVRVEGGRVSVQGVAGVMAINGHLAKMIFDHNKDKHAFYVEESYPIGWMYPYLEPYGIIMKINKEPLRSPQEDPALWEQIITRDRSYWDRLCLDLKSDPRFNRDDVAQKTFSKLRSAIGGVYAFRKSYPEAEHAFQQAVQLCPDSPEANFRLAQLYLEQEKFDDAASVMERYQKLDPNNPRISDAVKQIRNVQRQIEEIGDLEQQYVAQPDNLQVALRLVEVYARRQRLDAMDAVVDALLAREDLPAGEILRVANFYAQLNQLDRVHRLLTVYVQRAPGNPLGWYNLATVNATRNNCPESIVALQKAFALDSPDGQLRAKAQQDPLLNNCRSDPQFPQPYAQPVRRVPFTVTR